ncbi:hypothetical protein GJU40_15030 [Bacillus lacus]|uniref:Uncharacterized protein n=1 Tax=Metabacillus lacus TaxID=1983721 RepID=A0A7X2J105_9BACI|nr:hypothetical protein [Metabacillus lacus]MRX73456.1 hypothetical protein [Metabacillus lacus]
MGFEVFFFASWLAVSYFLLMKKRLSFQENAFVLMLCLIVNIQYTWIVFEEFERIQSSQDPFQYIAFLMNRSVIFPLVITILMNAAFSMKSLNKRILILALSVAVLTALSALSLLFEIISFSHWNLLYDAIYFTLLNIAVYFGLRGFHSLEKKGVRSTW